MTKKENTPGRKFLYSDYKKSQHEAPGKQFHSKGFHPNDKKALIDLEGVWSIKDMILDGTTKPTDTDGSQHTSTSYYSRYGKYNSPTAAGKQSHAQIGMADSKADDDSGSGQWSRKSVDTLGAQKIYQSSNAADPLDF